MGTNFLFSRRYILVLLCLFTHIVLSAKISEAQDPPPPKFPDPNEGMIFEKGAWRAPTAEESIQALMALDDSYDAIPIGESTKVSYYLYAVIQQGLGQQPRINLDAFVSDLFQIWLSETGWRKDEAEMALRTAGTSNFHDGSPYLGVKNELIRIYESIEEYPGLTANDVLYMLSEGWGISYVWDVFNSTPKPPVCSRTSVAASDNPCPNISPWCDAGELLIGQPGGPDKKEWEAICKWDEMIIHH